MNSISIYDRETRVRVATPLCAPPSYLISARFGRLVPSPRSAGFALKVLAALGWGTLWASGMIALPGIVFSSAVVVAAISLICVIH